MGYESLSKDKIVYELFSFTLLIFVFVLIFLLTIFYLVGRFFSENMVNKQFQG